MAVLPMSGISIIGVKKDRKKILETIQRMGVVEVRPFEDGQPGFEKLDTSVSQAKFLKVRGEAENALEILERFSPEDKPLLGFLHGMKRISVEDYEKNIEKRDEVLNIASGIVKMEKENSDLNAAIIKLRGNIEALMPWKALEFPMNFSGTRKTAAFLGSFSETHSVETLERVFAENCERKQFEKLGESVHFEVISQTETQTYVMAVCNKSLAADTEEVLRYMGFTAPAVAFGDVPAERIKKNEAEIREAEEKIADNKKKILEFARYRDDLKFIVDYFSMRIDKYKVIEQLGQSKNVFALTGYVPTKDVALLERVLNEKFGVAFEAWEADGEDVPVALSNNGFSAPVEGVLEAYSLPGKGEIDPTMVMSLFYYFLFGLMLSDAAYGLIMVLGCGFALWKFPHMNDGMKKSLKMYLYCGISTTFWGVMFGGYFGDAIQVIAATFFNTEIVIKPLWFSPLDRPMQMLMFSLLVGIVHLFAGLGMKLYSLIRDKQYKEALYDVVFWYLLVGGAIVFLLSTEMFVRMASLSFIFPPLAGSIAVWAMIIGALGITLTAGRSSKNPFKRIAKGLYELYGVTSYLSDILSYSRLLALGLATGVIANVFNKMGSMLGNGIIGIVGFIIIFIVGHSLNLAINLLGAYVHTNRLQFVEFFGKFYEGGGEKYTPFRADTGYIEIDTGSSEK